MKNNRRKRRRKKGKTSQGRTKELSSTEEDEINYNPREGEYKEDKELKPDEEQEHVNDLVCADPYSLYERTSLRQEVKKEYKSLETPLEAYEENRKHLNKSQQKSSLPPLKERQHRKRLTFVGERRANQHSILDTKSSDTKMIENNAPEFSEGRKKLELSLSFAGIYDLDDMRPEKKASCTKRNKKLDGILKSRKEETESLETLDKSEGTLVGVTPRDKETNVSARKRTKSYVIKTLTLEDDCPSSQRTSLKDKLILPGITKHTLSTRSNKFLDDEFKMEKSRKSESRLPSIDQSENRLPSIDQSENRLPSIDQSENRLPSIDRNENRVPKCSDSCLKRTNRHKRKERVHDNTFQQFYLETNIPKLPLLVNGRTKMSNSGP